MFIKTQGP